jgi:hypothetical protein
MFIKLPEEFEYEWFAIDPVKASELIPQSGAMLIDELVKKCSKIRFIKT